MGYVCGMFVLYVVLYVHVSCFVVRGCAVSRRYIDVCNCDVFSVVNVNLDNLKFCVGCIYGRRYVCCIECNVVSDGCDEPTSCLVQPVGGEVMYFWSVCFRGELGFLYCDAICMCVVNNQFKLLQYVLIPFMVTCSMMKFLLFLLLGLRACVVSVVMWLSFVCL